MGFCFALGSFPLLGVYSLLLFSPGGEAGSVVQMKEWGTERLCDWSKVTQLGNGAVVGLAPGCLVLITPTSAGNRASGRVL